LAPPATLGEVVRDLRLVVAARKDTTARAAAEWTGSLAWPQRGPPGLGSLITDRSAGRGQCVPVGGGLGNDSASQGEGNAGDHEGASEDSE
jgi:hypothetical protein